MRADDNWKEGSEKEMDVHLNEFSLIVDAGSPFAGELEDGTVTLTEAEVVIHDS